MKIILHIPTPPGSLPGSTDWVQVQAVIGALRRCIDYGGAWGIDNKIVALLKAAKMEKQI